MAERPSPLTPELNTLIEAAMRDWRAWAAALADAVAKLVTKDGTAALGKLSDSTREKLAALYDLHATELQLRMTGTAADPRLVRKALEGPTSGTLRPYVGPEGSSRLVTAYRVGRAHDPVSPTARDVERKPATMADVIKRASAKALTKEDEAALEFIQRRGAEYMRRPIQTAIQQVERTLSDAEARVVRGAVETGRTEKMGYKRLARELRDAMQGNPTLTNDMERVARTEAAFAGHAGALATLEEQAKAAGQGEDPEVYKFASPNACVNCLRIWGPNSNPTRYRLSEVRAGSNFGKPPAQWGPTIGPTHPNCTCPPIALYMPDVMSKTQQVLERLDRRYGR